MKKFFICFLVGIYFFPLRGQDFDSYLSIAIENNPELKASQALYKSRAEKVKQIGLEDPKLDLALYTPAMPRFAGNHLFDLNLMQMFPWFGTLRASRDEAKYMAKMEFEKYLDKKNELAFQVKSMWYDYYKSKKQEDYLNEELKLLTSLKNLMQAKLNINAKEGAASSPSAKMNEGTQQNPSNMNSMNMGGMSKRGSMQNEGMAGMNGSSMDSMVEGDMEMSSMGNEGAFGELLLLDLQIKELSYKLENKKNNSSYLLFAFNTLLNREKKIEIDLSKAQVLYPSISEVSTKVETNLENNPMVKMAFWDKKAKEYQKKMAQKMSMPMIGIGLSYMRFSQRESSHGGQKMDMNMNHMFMPMFSLSIPIYRKKYNAMQQEASLLRDASIYEGENIKNQLLSELKKLELDYKENDTKYRLLQEQIKITNILVRLKETAFKVGKSSMEELIKQSQKLLNYKKEVLEVLIKQNKTLAMLEKMIPS